MFVFDMHMRLRRIYYAILGVLFFVVILSFLPSKINNDSRQCFTKKSQLAENQKDARYYHGLEDVLEAKVQPKPDRSIFFIDTTCNIAVERVIWDKILDIFRPTRVNAASLTVRQACAIESAALHNPNLDVFVLFTHLLYQNSPADKKILNTLWGYKNINFRFLDLWSFTSDSPVRDFILKGKLFTSSFPIEHTSDLLRLLTLWKWGGIYLDMDMTVLRSLSDVTSNFVAAEPDHYLSNGVLSFSGKGTGHAILEMLLNDFQSNYEPEIWSHNGPKLLTRVFENVCQTPVKDMIGKKSCMGIKVFRSEAFSPIPYWILDQIFEEKFADSALREVNESYALHLWNHFSNFYELGKGNLGSLYNRVASKNCPRIYGMLKELD